MGGRGGRGTFGESHIGGFLGENMTSELVSVTIRGDLGERGGESRIADRLE